MLSNLNVIMSHAVKHERYYGLDVWKYTRGCYATPLRARLAVGYVGDFWVRMHLFRQKV